jgi:hypothetical protein
MGRTSDRAAEAFMNHSRFTSNNTKVKIDTEGNAKLFLFDNLIAIHYKEGLVSITNCGWNSVTTKARLNALPMVNIRSHRGEWSLHGEVWDGSWIDIIWADPICIMNKSK